MIQLCTKLSKGDTTRNVVTKTTLSLYVNFSPFLGAYLLLLIVRSIFKGDFKQLLDETFVVSAEPEAKADKRLAETLTISDITKTESNYCLITYSLLHKIKRVKMTVTIAEKFGLN